MRTLIDITKTIRDNTKQKQYESHETAGDIYNSEKVIQQGW